jgi:hypothetical protein
MLKAPGQQTNALLICKVVRLGLYRTDCLAGIIGLWQRMRVRWSAELCEGLRRGFIADYSAAVPDYEVTL